VAVVDVHIFRTSPGKLAEHLAFTTEAVGLLRARGLRANALQPVAGGDAGTISVVLNHADFTAYAAAVAAIAVDEEFQGFMVRASASASAEPLEVALLSDADPTYVLPADAPMGALMVSRWRPNPGRLNDFMADVMTATGHIQRLGGRCRTLQAVIGGQPLTLTVSTAFEDLAHYGEFSDKLRVDEQWQSFWTAAIANPSGAQLRSGLYVPIG
jgi:hypothetical protein